VAPERVKAHAFVADLSEPVLSDLDRHHLLRVLRVGPADLVTVSDGNGGLRRCRLSRSGELEPLGDVERRPRPVPPVTVGFAVVKGERPEWVVQKLTEVGVDIISPFVSDRSVVRWDAERAARNAERLRLVSQEAAMQSRRVFLPRVDPVVSFDLVARQEGAVRADLDGDPPDLGANVLLIGPEGGWSAGERAAVPAAVRFGDGVLRAETAAVAAGVLFTALRSGLARTARAQ
jgi:16S rRNA (uracil1498-N3)-methyltransferase